MKRDFSEFQKSKLLLMVKIIEPDSVFELVENWFENTALFDLQQRYFVIGAIKSLRAICSFHSSMIDKDTVSAQRIEEIFANAKTLDQSYKEPINNRLFLIVGYSNLLQKYSSCIFTDNSRFCSQDSVDKIQKSDIYKSYGYTYLENCIAKDPDIKTNENRKEEYITLFETIFPDYKEDMNTFFEPIQDDHQTDIDDIKYIVYTAEEPYRSLFLDNVGDAKWGYTAPHPEDGDDEKQFAYYRPNQGTINIDITTDNQYFEGDPRGKYATFFHEYGHYLDDRYARDTNGNKVSFTDTYVTSDGKDFVKVIDDDVKQVVKSKVKETFPDYSDDRVEKITKRLVKGNLPNYTEIDDDSIKQDAITVQTVFFDELNSAKADGPSDTYDGSTNFLADGLYGENSFDTGKGVSGLYQHGDDYYYAYKEGKLIKQGNCAAKESFATYFSVSIRRDAKSRALYETYLPGTTESFDNAAKDMLEKKI